MLAIRQREPAARRTLEEIRQLTAEVAQEEDPSLDVVAAVGRGGRGATEVILAYGDRAARESALTVVTVDRYASESELRQLLRERLRAQRHNQ